MNKLYRDKYVWGAIILFVVWKFFLIGIMWQDRSMPPEPDDSYIYAANIESVRSCPSLIFCSDSYYPLNSSTGFDRLSYRLWWGGLAKVFGLSSIHIYHLSFYLGTLMLIPVILKLISCLVEDKKQIIFIFLMLGLYSGSGSYHGFYWVVPSFFALLLFYLTLIVFIDEKVKKWQWWLLIIIPIGIYNHVIYLYSLSILGLLVVFDTIFKRSINKLYVSKLLLVVIIAMVSYLPSVIYLKILNKNTSYGVDQLLVKRSDDQPTNSTNVVPNTQDSKAKIVSRQINIFSQQSLDLVKIAYWKFLIPLPIFIILYLIILGSLIYARDFLILSLYSASLLFVYISCLSEYGFRGLIFLWPTTFIVYSAGLWNLKKIFGNVSQNNGLIKLTWWVGVMIFVLIDMSYSFLLNQKINKSADYVIDNSFIDYVENKGGENKLVYFDSKIIETYLVTINRSRNIKRTFNKSEADFELELPVKVTQESYFDKILRYIQKKELVVKQVENNNADNTIMFGDLIIVIKK